MKKIQIHCPWHGNQEEIEIPDGYTSFEGEVKCASGARIDGNIGGPFVLHIRLASGQVIEVSRAGAPK